VSKYPVHDTVFGDVGTSEGAKKAAATRKAGGGAAQHTYTHLRSSHPTEGYRSKSEFGGYTYRLRRSDGKIVNVSSKRFQELDKQGRLRKRTEEEAQSERTAFGRKVAKEYRENEAQYRAQGDHERAEKYRRRAEELEAKHGKAT
jgi:hypothetical protein